MKRILALAMSALVVTSASFAQEPKAAPAAAAVQQQPKVFEVGKPVDENIVFTDLDGKSVTGKELKGKTVVLAWYCTSCPYIPPAIPKLEKIAADYKDKNVVLIAISSNVHDTADAVPAADAKDEKGNPVKPFAKLRKNLAERKVTFKVCVDVGNKLADQFQAKTTPHMYVIDAKGVLRYSGALDDDPKAEKKDGERKDYVRSVVDALLQGKEPPVTTTAPYGCGVKRVAVKPAA